MNKINFTNNQHLSVNLMNFMQDAYTKPIEALAQSSGIKSFIVSGVERSDNGAITSYSDGAVVLDGVFMEFRHGTFNGNDEKADYYVVKKTETIPNYKSDGTPDPLTVTYATLGEYQPGAIDIFDLAKKTLVPTVTFPSTEGDIITDLKYPTAVIARTCGFYPFEGSAKPRYYISGNRVSLYGAFSVSGSGGRVPVLELGQIPNWEGGSIPRIKCTMYAKDNFDYDYMYHGFAGIRGNGEVYARDVAFTEDVNVKAIIFDGTPYTMLPTAYRSIS